MVDYVCGKCIVWPCLTMEVSVIMIFYGPKKLTRDLSFMLKETLGYSFGNFWIVCWISFAVISVIAIPFYFDQKHEVPTYKKEPVPDIIYSKFQDNYL